MLKGFSSIFRRRSSQDPSSLRDISPEANDLLDVFREKLNLIESIPSEEDKINLVSQAINQFGSTFKDIIQTHVQTQHFIRSCLERYTKCCSELGVHILACRDLRTKMFDSLVTVNVLFNSKLPNAAEFISMFSQIVQFAKADISLIDDSYSFIAILLQTREFFTEFLEIDGYGLIFTMFFMGNCTEGTKKFLKLLFDELPTKYHRESNQATIELLMDSLASEKTPAIALFVANYVAACFDINKFKDDGGFLLLNQFLIKNCDEDIVVSCYEVMLQKCNQDVIIIQSLFELFVNPLCIPALRHQLLVLIKNFVTDSRASFTRFNESIPLIEWILPPPQIDIDGYNSAVEIIYRSVETGFVVADTYTECLIELIEPPADETKPVCAVARLLRKLLMMKKITPEQLIEHKFLEKIFIRVDNTVFAKYINITEMQDILCELFSSRLCEDFRFSILQKLISVYDAQFGNLINRLIRRDLPVEVFSMLLSHLTDGLMTDIVLNAITANYNSFDLFMQCAGFEYAEEFLSTKPESNETVLKLLIALSEHKHYEQIENFVLGQPADSTLFKCSKDLMAKAATKIGAFAPFCDSFESDSPFVFMNAAKYGVMICKKFGIDMAKIAEIRSIANVYCMPEMMDALLSDVGHIHELVDCERFPQKSAYEFSRSSNITTMIVQSQDPIKNVSFSVFCRKNMNCNIMKFAGTDWAIRDGLLLITTPNSCEKVMLDHGWVHVNLSVMQRKLSAHVGVHHFDVPIPELVVRQFVFGDPDEPIMSNIIISSNILVNGMERYAIVRKGNVDLVEFKGFASMFDGKWSAEKIFGLFEKTTTIEEYTSVYMALVNMHMINRYDDIYFWKRLLVAVKKHAKVIQPNLLMFLHQVPLVSYRAEKRAAFTSLMLKDLELYFSFDSSSIIALVKILSSDLDDIIVNVDTDVPIFLLHAMKAGLDANLCIELTKMIEKMLTLKPTCNEIREFVKIALTVDQWSLQLHSDFPIGMLLDLDTSESPLQTMMLNVAVKLIGMLDKPAFTLGDLVLFSLQFEDERALCFLKMIAVCSAKDKDFITNYPDVRFAFGRFSESEEVWNLALSIWNGGPECISTLSIERPLFTATILEMLIRLSRKQASMSLYAKSPDKIDLLKKVLELIVLIPIRQGGIFTQPEFIGYTLLLMNMGMVPYSCATENSEGKRIENLWNNLETVSLTAEDIQQMTDGSDLFKDPQLTNAIAPILKYEDLPFDHLDNEWLKKLPIDHFLMLYAHILVSVHPQMFDQTFQELIAGHDLMYDCYRKFLMEEVSLAVLVQCTQSEAVLHKNPLRVIWNCVRTGIFAHRYLDLLSMVMSFMKKRFDVSVVREFRNIILMAFHFLGESEMTSLFNVLYSFRDLLFHYSVIADVKFCHHWLYNTGRMQITDKPFIECVSMTYGSVKQDYLNSYVAETAEEKWKEYTTGCLSHQLPSSRSHYAGILVDKTKKELVYFTKILLGARIRRITNLYTCTMNQLNAVNIWMRQHEAFYFKYKQVERTINMDLSQPKSYHLSQNSLPGYASRVVSPSPFPLRCPEMDVKTTTDDFRRQCTATKSNITQIEYCGEQSVAHEWFHFHTDDGETPFNYSFLLNYPRLDLLNDFYAVYGQLEKPIPVFLYNYIHQIPCTMFYSPEKIVLVVLAECNEKSMALITEPSSPIAFLPFAESVTLNEWHNVSLFCGHIVLTFEVERLLQTKTHLYVHQKRALSFSYLFDPNFVLVFKNLSDFDSINKKFMKQPTLQTQLSGHRYLFSYEKITEATDAWMNRQISNYEYLLILNAFGGRSFSDLSQYPVFPWVSSPDLEPRNLALPMGQLGEKRAKHYDDTYHDSYPKYFYGCHYSLPGAVFWFMVRLPPFTFFMWDLNEGWDHSQRMFTSITDCWHSASFANQTDLKEPLPELFTVPELYIDSGNMKLNDVVLPKWTMDSPYLYVAMMRKFMEESENINEWIDLIFGVKQKGEQAVCAKNIFLPSSYHDSTAESLDIEQAAFEDQVINFGQCPIQLFEEVHPPRKTMNGNNDVRVIEHDMAIENKPLRNPASITNGIITRDCVVIPTTAAVLTPSNDFFITAESHKLVVRKVHGFDLVFEKPMMNSGSVSAISVSHDGLFISVAFDNAKFAVFQVTYDTRIPVDLAMIHQFTITEPCSCSRVAISSEDFLVAAAFSNKILIYNFATKLLHRILIFSEEPIAFEYDDFEGILTVAFKHKIEQYSVNGKKLRELTLETEISSFCVIPYEPRFDCRVVCIGDVKGTLSFYIVVESFKLRKLFDRSVFDSPCSSLFFDKQTWKLYVSNGVKFGAVIDFVPRQKGVTPTCQFCTNTMTGYCQKCHVPICDKCTSKGGSSICPSCLSQLDFMASFRF